MASGALCLLACTGAVGGDVARLSGDDASNGKGGRGGGGSASPGDPSNPLSCATPRVPKTPFRRLTPKEIDRSVSALLGSEKAFAQSILPPHDAQNGFANDSTRTEVTSVYADKLMRTAEAWAEEAVTRSAAVLPCDGAAALPDSSCVRDAVARLVGGAFRRPAGATEVDSLVAAFRAGHAAGGVAEGVGSLVGSLILSPSFVLEVEVGAGRDGELVALTDHEIATRLAYRLTGGPPDAALAKEADQGRMHTSQQVLAQAQRLAETPQAHAVLASFADGWLELEKIRQISKDAKQFPEFSPSLVEALHEEAVRFVDAVLWGEATDGRFKTLLTTRATRIDGRHAPIYGPDVVAAAAPMRMVNLPPKQRAGILTLPGVMASHAYLTQTSPIHRGLFVQQRLLCVSPPAPPASAVISEPPVTEGTTSRQRFEAHRTDPACAGCHRLLDPLGFAFEHYDALGRYRDTEAGQRVDARGELDGPYSAINGSFYGAIALAERLADSKEAESCTALQAYRFASGRSETDDDACSVQQMQERFAATGGDLRQLMLAFVQTPAFLYRASEEQNKECKQ